MSERRSSIGVRGDGDDYMQFMAGACIFMFFAMMGTMDWVYVVAQTPETEGFRESIRSTVFVPISYGILVGHWFHPGRYGPDLLTYLKITPNFQSWTAWLFWLGGAGITLGIGLIGVATGSFTIPAWLSYVIGVVLGVVWWPVYTWGDTRPEWLAKQNIPPETAKPGLNKMIAAFVLVAVIAAMVVIFAFPRFGWVIASIIWMVATVGADVMLLGNREGDTWSEQISQWGREVTSLVPWAFGVFAGRWFTPVPDLGLVSWPVGVTILALLSVVVFIYAFIPKWTSKKVDERKLLPAWLFVILGTFAGALFWSSTYLTDS